MLRQNLLCGGTAGGVGDRSGLVPPRSLVPWAPDPPLPVSLGRKTGSLRAFCSAAAGALQ